MSHRSLNILVVLAIFFIKRNLWVEKMANQMDENDIEITICKGDYSHIGSAEVGVKLVHRPTNITVYSLKKKSQYANKVIALELLKLELVKQRFE